MSKTENNKENLSLKPMVSEEMAEMLGLDHFPYPSKLSFVPLIDYYKKLTNHLDEGIATLANNIVRELDNALEFQAPIEDPSLIDKHKGFVELLMSGLFPSGLRSQDLGRAARPFSMDGFFHTPALEEIMRTGQLKFCLDKPKGTIRSGSIIKAGSLILNQFYGQNIKADDPVIFTMYSESGHVEKHYKSVLNIDFVEIKKLKPLKALSQQQINSLLSNIYDLDLWLDCLPPENFAFHGLVFVNLTDITEQETLSRLKHHLLEKDAIVSPDKINKLNENLRSYFGLPGLRIGLTAIDYPPENAVGHRYKIRHDFLASRFEKLLHPDFKGSIYERACKYGYSTTVEDLEKVYNPTPLEKALLEEGIRSIVISPLKNEKDHIIGLLELGSPRPFELNSFTVLRLEEIIPLFRTALQRSREEIDNAIEVIIREQYTALHQSVEWKFVENAFNLLEKRESEGPNAKVEPIVFKDVHPLYGQADIVRSSTIRNEAIQADLLDNLQQILQVLEKSLEVIPFPLVDHYIFHIRKEIKQLKKGISTNDEYRVLHFFKEEIHPLFEQLKGRHKTVDQMITAYFNYLDDEIEAVYRRRKDFEESVAALNDMIADYLDEQERISQRMLPHYFERYKTDGVEFEIYAGQALLKSERFDNVHLKNLRLWQLMVMCEITRMVEKKRPELAVELTTAQLILVHSSTLAIRFRMDEKQFDVDGAYNIRYEIIKKRIDKALIAGTDERLTQSGKVAIVYADEKDREDYLEFMDYLIQRGYITEEVEDLHLEKMQGVDGMRALRVTVKIPAPEEHSSGPSDLLELLETPEITEKAPEKNQKSFSTRKEKV